METNEFYNKIIAMLGINNDSSFIIIFLKLLIALTLSYAIYIIVRTVVNIITKRVISRKNNRWGIVIYETKFMSRLMLIIPPILFNIFIGNIEWDNLKYVMRLSEMWIVISSFLMLISLSDGIVKVYNTFEVSRNRPITALMQIIKMVLAIIVVIIIASIILQKSPANLLYGLGAFTAVLMLVFKDTILGFVAGIQLMSNNMLAIGDWVEMPNGEANGEVQEVNLYTVKIQNWNMTISTVPTHQLVAQPFTNWRGMSESGGRRINRSVNIDINTIKFIDKSFIESLTNNPILADYIEHLSKVNETTNVGLFRAYILEYLKRNENINKDMTLMVKQQQPTPQGMPLDIYCFSLIKDWVAYEAIQSAMFEHIVAIAPLFELKIYQYPNIPIK